MKIVLACDHGGYELKEFIKEYLNSKGHEVMDMGTNSCDSVDYTDYGIKAGELVARGEAERGIVFCGTGIGISVAANKVKGVICALCSDPFSAEMARRHNDSNVLALGGRVLGKDLAKRIVSIWINTEFEGERHLKRINKIREYENKK